MNLTVNRLIRTGFGPFRLGKMLPGGVAELQILPHFTAQLTEAMETGIPVRAPNVRPTASAGSRGVVKRPLSKPPTEGTVSSGLARARPASPRPYTAAISRTNSNSSSGSKTRVKRGRGGGIAVRPPKESPREQVAADRKRKKYNKVQAWALRHSKPKSKPAARGRGPNARTTSSTNSTSDRRSGSSSRRSYS
jgi:hypothetical protein